MFTGDRALQLGREQYIRPMSIGYNWTKLRVGFRYTVQFPASVATGSFTLAYGLTCQSKQYFDANADMVYTAYSSATDLSATPTFLVNGFTATYGLGNYNKVTNQTKVGVTYNQSSVGSNNQTLYMLKTLRGIVLCDFTRGSGTITVQPWARSASSPLDQAQSDFLINMEHETTPPFVTTGSLPTGALTYGGTGLLDSLWLFWGNWIPLINIHDIAVCRFY